jgi:hypothetical protein
MAGRIFYKNLIRTLDPISQHVGWSNTHRLTDEDPRLCAMATGSSGAAYEIIYDLGVARTSLGAAVVNHNITDIGATYFRIHTGSTDDGITWDELRLTAGNLATYPAYTPSFAGAFSGSVTRRYWRFFFSLSMSTIAELHIGQLCLFNARGYLPAAPWSPLEWQGQDTAVLGRGLGGYESRHDAGVGSHIHRMRWKREPGNVSTGSQVRDMLRYARKYAQWGLEPVCWVRYDAEKPNPTYDVHPCAYCVMENLADAEVLTVGSTRRYDVSLQLRELTFHGLL